MDVKTGKVLWSKKFVFPTAPGALELLVHDFFIDPATGQVFLSPRPHLINPHLINPHQILTKSLILP